MYDDKELKKIIPKNEDQKALVDRFLDNHYIPQLKGRYFLQQMILYMLNNDETLLQDTNIKMYEIIAQANNTTWYNVMRLSRYAIKKAPLYKYDTSKLMNEAFWQIKKELEKQKYEEKRKKENEDY